MRKLLALVRKEAGSILKSPPVLFATAFFVLLDSFAFHLTTATPATAYAIFDDVALFMLFTSIIMFPLISMHSFSEDYANGTLETLLTAPISHFTAVMAKYSGAMLYVLVYLLHGFVYALLMSYGGNLDWNSTLAAFLALFAVGSLAMSLGVFISALTVSPTAAAAGTGGVLVFLAIAADIDPYSGRIADLLHRLSFVPHAKRWIAGELDTRGLVYFASATVLFLFYAWLSVGSRGTDRNNANPTVRRRLTVTYILVSSGFLLLVLQAAILHIKGFWESGTPMGPSLWRIPGRYLVPICLSVVCFAWSFLTYRAARRAERGKLPKPNRKYATISDSRVSAAPRYYYEENLRSRRRTIMAAVAALVVVVNLNWLSHYPFRTFAGSGGLGFLTVLQERSWDVSEDGRNSLSPTTARTLDGLQGRVQIYSFLSDTADVQDVPVAEEMRRLLERYSDHNALVSVTFADAIREPELARHLAEDVDVPLEGLENILVVDYQGRRLTVSAPSLVAPPDWRAQMSGEKRWVFDGENRLTQTLMRLIDPRSPNVYFTYGHREHSPTPGPYPDRTVSKFVRAMAGANMRVRQHTITPSRPIPPECDILVVAAPRVPFLKHEVDEIRRYVDRGGRLFVFASVPDPEYRFDDDPLNEFLFSIGGSYRNDVAEDPKHNDNGQSMAPLGMTRGTGEGAVSFVFPLTRSIRDNPRCGENGWTAERVIESHPTAIAADLGGGGLKSGPFTLLYRTTSSAETREARVAVAASGRMVADSDIGRGANEALLIGVMQWLAGREESRDIAPRPWIDRRLTITGPQLRAILWLGVVALPLGWLMAGISIWWLRKD